MPQEETEEERIKREAKLRYRFRGFRYQLQGPAKYGPSEVVPEVTGFFAFPRDGSLEDAEGLVEE